MEHLGLTSIKNSTISNLLEKFFIFRKMSVQLVSSSGKVLEDKTVDLKISSKWKVYKLTLFSDITDAKAKLVLVFEGTGTVWLDYVSLFPNNTFKNRPNGLREDIVSFLSDLNPEFVRWPGGCIETE